MGITHATLRAESPKVILTCCVAYELPANRSAHLFPLETGVRQGVQSGTGYRFGVRCEREALRISGKILCDFFS